LLVPVADSAALTRAALELLDDQDLADRLATRGREVVVAEFSLDAMIHGVTRIYREVA
jgi:glycosyltransferase involved in cell wall biosynthesis